MKSIKAIFRRGQSTKGEQVVQGGGSGGDLSRTSSISNINVAEQKSKGALSKTKKPTSREKLDKIVGDKEKRNDKKGNTYKTKFFLMNTNSIYFTYPFFFLHF